jgi:hypothetical protein
VNPPDSGFLPAGQFLWQNKISQRSRLRLAGRPPLQSGRTGGRTEVFDPIIDVLLAKGDFCLHLADLRSYSEAHARPGGFYRNPQSWAQEAIRNVASSGKFSSDRTIAQYAAEIWNVKACPVPDVAVADMAGA